MICIIPARGGSQRIPKKNIKDFHGKPIIAYSIELGKETCGRVIVSTDSDEIGAVALAYGAEVHHRSPELSRDEIGTQEVAKAVIEEMGLKGDICVLYATSPLLTWLEIESAHFAQTGDVFARCFYSISREDGLPTGGFYIGDHEFFREEADPYVHGAGFLTADIDINTPEDWKLAEQLYEERYGHN